MQSKLLLILHHPRVIGRHLIISSMELDHQPAVCRPTGTTVVSREAGGEVARGAEHVELAGAAVLPPSLHRHHECPAGNAVDVARCAYKDGDEGGCIALYLRLRGHGGGMNGAGEPGIPDQMSCTPKTMGFNGWNK